MKVKNEFLKLKNKISKKSATIAIIGQGYVGLPSSIYIHKKF